MSLQLTRRGRAALLVTAVLVLGLTVAAVAVVRSVTDDHCTVEVGDRSVRLDRDVAERVTAAAATAIRRGESVPDAVRRTMPLSVDARDAVTAAVSGRAHAALTCRGGGSGDAESDALSGAGLTRRAERVRTAMAGAFGGLPLGGFEPGGVTDGHMPGSAHYEGRAIDVFFRPVNARNKDAGWALAHYLVAHAERLDINTVIFDARVWTAARSAEGWRDYRVSHANRTRATIRILEHRDHVHVDVAG